MTEIFEFSAPVASLADLCRLCGEVDNVCVNVFDEGSEELNLVNKIEIAVRISIAPNDTLPKGICTECHEKLNGYSLFYKLCHDTQERLLEFLSIQSAIHQSDGTQELDSEENYGLSVKDNHNDDQDEIFYDGEAQLGDEDDDVEVHVMVSDDIIQDGALTESQEATKAEDAEKSLEGESSTRRKCNIYIQPSQAKLFQSTDENNEHNGPESSLMDDPVKMETKNKKVVYLVKNAAHMPIESVISAVLESSGASGKLIPVKELKDSSKIIKKRRLNKKKTDPQKVLVKGSDGKESMVIVDVPRSIKQLQNHEELVDPTWTPGNADHEYTSPASINLSAVSSKLRRARNAVRMSVRTLRLPKPKNQTRDVMRDKNKYKCSEFTVHKPIGKDDPNYATMMEKFSKPVSRSTLKRHGLYTPIRRNACKINAPYKDDVAPYIEKISDTEFKCKICLSATFRWNYKAEIHILEHLKWKPFECEVCGRGFTQNQYLRKHKRLHFPDDTTFMCEICGKGFQRRYYLTYHMDEHYDRTYTCEECSRVFTSRRKHDEHIRYHHKCNYTVCDVCGSTLRTTAFARHRRHHFNESKRRGEKMLKTDAVKKDWLSCEICGCVLSSESVRERHVMEHNDNQNPYQCCVCSNYFKTKQALVEHGELHNHEVKEDELEEATRILDEITSGAMVTISS